MNGPREDNLSRVARWPSAGHRPVGHDALFCLALAALGTAASYLSVSIPYTPLVIEGRWVFGFIGFAMLSRWWLALVLAGILSASHYSPIYSDASMISNIAIAFTGNMIYALPSLVVIRTVEYKLLRTIKSLALYAMLWFLMVLLLYQMMTPLIFGTLAVIRDQPIWPTVVDSWIQQPYAVESLLVALLTAMGASLFQSHLHLRAKQRELATTMDSIGDGVIATDLQGRITRMNPVAETLTGWAFADAKGQPLSEVFRIINEVTRQPVESPVDIVLRERHVVGLANSTLLIARDGTERAIADSGSPIQRPDGKIMGVVLVFRDQTPQRNAQRKARESQSQLEAIYENAPLLMVLVDSERQIRRANERAASFAGREVSDMVGRISGDALRCLYALDNPNGCGHSENCRACTVRQTVLDTLRTGQPHQQIEATLPFRKGGNVIERTFLLSATQLVIAEEPMALVTLLDITERKASGRKTEFQARVLDQIHDCVTVTDMEGNITYVNEATARLLGQPREKLIGRHVSMYGEDPATGMTQERIINETRETGQWRGEIVNVTAEGQQVTLDCRTKVLCDAGGKAFCMVGISTDITEWKRATEMLRQANRIIASSPAVAMTWRNEEGWPVEYASPGAAKLTGYEVEELLAEDFRYDSLIHPNDLPRIIEEVDSARSNPKAREVRHQPYRLVDRQGRIHWIEDVTTLRRNPAGEVTHFDGVLLDVTGRKQAEEAYSRVCEVASEMICSADIHTATFLEVNPAFERVLGYAREELLNQSFLAFVHPDDVSATQDVMGNKLAAGEAIASFENRYRCKDGSYKYIEWNAHPITEEGITYAIAHDVTQRKAREEALRRSEQRFRSFVENANDIVYAIDPEGFFTYISPNWLEFMGEPAEAALGKNFRHYVHPDDLHICLGVLQKIVDEKGAKGSIEYRSIRPDGQTRWYVSRGSALYDDDGAFTGYVGIARDVTAEKQAQQERETLESQLRQASKMEAVGRLAGGVAHDFNNMLQTILGYSDMALDDTDPESTLHTQLSEIRHAAQRSADLTKQLLAFARKQTIDPQILDLNEITSNALKMLGRLIGEDIDLQWYPGEAWPVKMDPTQYDRILANLIVNARDAITGPGRIVVETGRAHFDEAYCNDHPGFHPGQFTMLAVSDNGHGMDAETLSQIFEPFFTTKPQGEGTGLGLATVYGVVKQNDGFINVYSEPNIGTTLRIYLARDEGENDEDSVDIAAPDSQTGSETILLVEDETTLLRLAQRLLEDRGYHVLAANAPQTAIEIAQNFDGHIHVLLTDVVMPEMSGRELWGHLCDAYPHLKCVFMSGYTANVIAEHGVLGEGVNFLQKPFSSSDLHRKLRAVIDDT
jgi:PAS domain S-box-containing protein